LATLKLSLFFPPKIRNVLEKLKALHNHFPFFLTPSATLKEEGSHFVLCPKEIIPHP